MCIQAGNRIEKSRIDCLNWTHFGEIVLITATIWCKEKQKYMNWKYSEKRGKIKWKLIKNLKIKFKISAKPVESKESSTHVNPFGSSVYGRRKYKRSKSLEKSFFLPLFKSCEKQKQMISSKAAQLITQFFSIISLWCAPVLIFVHWNFCPYSSSCLCVWNRESRETGTLFFWLDDTHMFTEGWRSLSKCRQSIFSKVGPLINLKPIIKYIIIIIIYACQWGPVLSTRWLLC